MIFRTTSITDVLCVIQRKNYYPSTALCYSYTTVVYLYIHLYFHLKLSHLRPRFSNAHLVSPLLA